MCSATSARLQVVQGYTLQGTLDWWQSIDKWEQTKIQVMYWQEVFPETEMENETINKELLCESEILAGNVSLA